MNTSTINEDVAEELATENKQEDPLKLEYDTLIKQLRGVRLVNDASKLKDRQEATDELIPKMETQLLSFKEKKDNATSSLDRLAYAQREKEAEAKVTKLRTGLEAIDERADELYKEAN